jgi:hypothetical protein
LRNIFIFTEWGIFSRSATVRFFDIETNIKTALPMKQNYQQTLKSLYLQGFMKK